MHPIIFCRVISTDKTVAGRLVAGKTVMRIVAHMIDSDLITHVSESFVDYQTPQGRSREWPDSDKLPEKLSEIHYVENELLQAITDVLDSPEEICLKIGLAQFGGASASGSTT